MLNARKKIGIGLVLTGAALLLLAFLAIPLAWGGVAEGILLGAAAVLFVAAACLMWNEGLRAVRAAGRPEGGHLHVMRQSGFFDLVIGMLCLALLLGILCGIGARS